MNTKKKEPTRPSYVLKVGEDNRRYAHDLLVENEKLRFLVATLENERSSLLTKAQLTDHLLREHDAMRDFLATLEQEKRRLQDQLRQLRADRAKEEQDREHLQKQLAEIETQNQRFSTEYVEVERRNNNLMNLYVASYRLHGTLDRLEVLGTIQEIVANLVGCEEQGIFEVDATGRQLQLVASIGIDHVAYARIPVGEGAIGRAVLEGETFVAASEPRVASEAEGGERTRSLPIEADLTACIPLKLNGRVTGAIALFRMLPQKPALEEVDHELFDLLATHAATALYCTRLHETSEAAVPTGQQC